MTEPKGAAHAAMAMRATQDAPQEDHLQVTLTIPSTGKHFIVSHPIGMTDGELLDVIGWMATRFRAYLTAQREQVVKPAVPRIVLPDH